MIQHVSDNEQLDLSYRWPRQKKESDTVTVTEALVLRPLLEDQGRITESIRILVPYLGARRQNETEMVSDHDKTSPSIAVVSALSVACSMLAVQQQKRLCRQFVIVSAARRGCHTGENAISRTCTYKRIDILTAGFRYYRLRWLHTRRRAGADRVSKQ